MPMRCSSKIIGIAGNARVELLEHILARVVGWRIGRPRGKVVDDPMDPAVALAQLVDVTASVAALFEVLGEPRENSPLAAQTEIEPQHQRELHKEEQQPDADDNEPVIGAKLAVGKKSLKHSVLA